VWVEQAHSRLIYAHGALRAPDCSAANAPWGLRDALFSPVTFTATCFAVQCFFVYAGFGQSVMCSAGRLCDGAVFLFPRLNIGQGVTARVVWVLCVLAGQSGCILLLMQGQQHRRGSSDQGELVIKLSGLEAMLCVVCSCPCGTRSVIYMLNMRCSVCV
jgi:hypothetical protein